jgi:hypothetical protein
VAQAAPVALETPRDAGEPAAALKPVAAWELPASGRSDLSSVVDLGGRSGDEAALPGDADGVLLGLLRDAPRSEGTSKPRVDGAVTSPEPAVAPAARSPLRADDATGDVVYGGLFDALAPSDQQLGFVSEVREWYQGIGPGAGAEVALGDPDEGGGMTGGTRGDKPVRERLVPQPVIDFLRENRVWIFLASLGCALLVLAFDLMRRSARGSPQRRATADRRLPPERRTSQASAASAERRTASPRRAGPDRRSSPHPAAR